MYSLADYYRRRGLVAQQEAARTSNDHNRNLFQEVARGWFELADISDHLHSAKTGSLVARRRTQSWKPNSETSSNERATKKEPGRLPTPRREVPRSGAQSINRKRTGKPAVHGEKMGFASGVFATKVSTSMK
jgi:hypothetical protein